MPAAEADGPRTAPARGEGNRPLKPRRSGSRSSSRLAPKRVSLRPVRAMSASLDARFGATKRRPHYRHPRPTRQPDARACQGPTIRYHGLDAGEVPEWPIGRHWKCRVRLVRTAGSNPALSVRTGRPDEIDHPGVFTRTDPAWRVTHRTQSKREMPHGRPASCTRPLRSPARTARGVPQELIASKPETMSKSSSVIDCCRT